MTRSIQVVVPFCIGDQDLELLVTADFRKGRPAYIPSGGGGDPPEGNEYDIESVKIREDIKDSTWVTAQDAIHRAVVRDYYAGGLVWEKLESESEEEPEPPEMERV